MRDLLEEWAPRVYRFALRLTLDAHVAEDLTQEAMLRAWQRRPQLRQIGSLRVWLFRITMNLWKDQLRRRLRRRESFDPLVTEVPSSAPTAEQVVTGQEDLHRALAMLDALPPRQREILYLSSCEGLTPTEIAAILDITREAVRASLSVARQKLRQMFQPLGAEEAPQRKNTHE